MPHTPFPAELLARAAKIRLACFDVDGTLTNGRLYIDDEGRETKAFHVADGQGLIQLRKAGIALAFITARKGGIAGHRATELGAEAHAGVGDKLACMEDIRARLGIAADAVAFMGDDLPDRAPMRAAGLAVAPANAHAWVLDVAHWQTSLRGGEGAARELCDLLLTAQGRVEGLLSGNAAPGAEAR